MRVLSVHIDDVYFVCWLYDVVFSVLSVLSEVSTCILCTLSLITCASYEHVSGGGSLGRG
jgi:hypothetical protein